jgi:hypothetical protein
MENKFLSEEVLRMKRLANIISESQYVQKINEDINNNSLYRNLMDVLSSSNASKKEKKDILETILKDMDDAEKFRDIATNN